MYGPGKGTAPAGLVTTTQQVGITIGIPLLGVLATTRTGGLYDGVRLVLAIDAAVVLGAALLVAVGLRRWTDEQPA